MPRCRRAALGPMSGIKCELATDCETARPSDAGILPVDIRSVPKLALAPLARPPPARQTVQKGRQKGRLNFLYPADALLILAALRAAAEAGDEKAVALLPMFTDWALSSLPAAGRC